MNHSADYSTPISIHRSVVDSVPLHPPPQKSCACAWLQGGRDVPLKYQLILNELQNIPEIRTFQA
jgi:hypothetical protein